MLALAGAAALDDGHQDADDGIEAGAHVGHRRADAHRAAPRRAVAAAPAGHRLAHRGVTRHDADTAAGAEAGHAAMYGERDALRETARVARAPPPHPRRTQGN